MVKSLLSDLLLREYPTLSLEEEEFSLSFPYGSVLNCLPGSVSGVRCPVPTVALMPCGIGEMSKYPEKK